MYETESKGIKSKGFALLTTIATYLVPLPKVIEGKASKWVKLESKRELLDMWSKATKSRIQGPRRDG